MELLIQPIGKRLAVGRYLQALIALDIPMVYGTIKLINFARGCVHDGGVHWIFCGNGLEDECIRSAFR